jgi:ribonuclease T
LRRHECRRAILLGHNAAFDLGFLNAAVARTGIKRNPFHPFSSFDTATLAGAAFGQTVLAKAAKVAELEWDNTSAHSARYDAQRTAELFCRICNELRPVYLEADRRAQQLGWVEGIPEVAAAASAAGADGEATTPSPS